MPSTREIRRRIRSVKNTAQITKAMQMVASSKMRRAQERAVVRGERPARVAPLAPGAAERALDRPARRGERHAAAGVVALGGVDAE